MKLLLPFKQVEHLEALLWLGADEFYCGISPNIASQIDRLRYRIDRRMLDDYARCHLLDYRELKKAVEIIHQHGKRVFLTVNEYFCREQWSDIQSHLKYITSIDPDGLIVSDLGLLLKLRKCYSDIPVNISMLASVLNSESAKFFAKLGADRIIIPRNLFLDEIKSLVTEFDRVEWEAFADFFVTCSNLEGFCSYLHGLNPKVPTVCAIENNYSQNQSLRPDNTQYTCRLCALYDYHSIGIGYIKLTGREFSFPLLYAAAYLVKTLIDTLDNIGSKQEFVRFAQTQMRLILHNAFMYELMHDIGLEVTPVQIQEILGAMVKGISCLHGVQICPWSIASREENM